MMWIIKTEPDDYSWEQMKKDKVTKWDGVTNWQALANMRQMKIGDECFFYHTGKEKAIVGIAIVDSIFESNDDKQPKIGAVNIRYNADIKKLVTLKEMKDNPLLKHLFKQPRLSIIPVNKNEGNIIKSLLYH